MEIRNKDFEGMTVTREQMIKLLNKDGMTNDDFQDFVEEFGQYGPFQMTDIRAFLGY